MVYFFHHYELPAVLQQAQVQRLLNRNGRIPGRGVSQNSANQETASTGGESQESVTVDGTDQTRNTHTEHRDEHENENILQNHIDQGLLNEIFEGVDDIQIGGFNIDQELLTNIEEEIQVIQNSHNRTVSSSVRQQDSDPPVTADSNANSSHQQENPDSTGAEISATLPATCDCDSVNSTDGATVLSTSETQSGSCDTPSQSKQSENSASSNESAIDRDIPVDGVRYRGNSNQTVDDTMQV